jgi:hypothetical protein
MNRYPHIATGTLVLLLFSCINLGLLAYAGYRDDDAEGGSSEWSANDRRTVGRLSLVLATASQMLYLGFVAVWWFKLTDSYPGRPIQMIGIVSGLLLSAGALVTGMFGTGLKRTAVAFVGLTTGLLWLLSLVASSTV